MSFSTRRIFLYVGIALVAFFFVFFVIPKILSTKYNSALSVVKAVDPVPAPVQVLPLPVLDTVLYDKKMIQLANYPAPIVVVEKATVPVDNSKTITPKTSPIKKTAPIKQASPNFWPVKTVYPNFGALLPFNRIVAYYGNFYSKGMGVLGEYSTTDVLAKLNGEVDKWKLADPTTPVVPAIDYIAVTAQGSPGSAKKYRLRMPDDQIEKALALADKVHGIVFLDVQVGLSDMQTEIPLLEKYLKMPQVHLAIDPEFSMKTGAKPGTVIGTVDASDINYVAGYLAGLVKANNLPPKILVVHRFTLDMVTNYKLIKPLPEVQVVMDMDGWGSPAKKVGTYRVTIYGEPVQFTGFKLFYKNDVRAPSTRMLTPEEILKLIPQPSYIQYQ